MGEIEKGCWLQVELRADRLNDARRDRLDLLHIGADQGMLANQVDEARNSLRVADRRAAPPRATARAGWRRRCAAFRRCKPVVSSLVSGCVLHQSEMRWRSWRTRGSQSFSSSSGWPESTICTSFSDEVSRLVSKRISSRSSQERFCASSITMAHNCLFAEALDKPAIELQQHARLGPHLGRNAKVSEHKFKKVEHIETRIEDKGRRNAILGRKSFRTALSRVVFPVPTSPVMTTKPLRAAMPYCRQASASRICGV